MRSSYILLLLLYLMPTLLFAKELKKKEQLLFIENKGQVIDQFYSSRNDVDFKVGAQGINIFIGKGELHYQFYKNNSGQNISMYRMDVVLVNANKKTTIITEGKQDYYESYFPGNIQAVAHSYTRIIYKDVYPSIDWILYITEGQLEYDFVIHKGGNPSDIQLQYNGATSLSVNRDGSLSATTPMGTITEAAPYAYQEDGKQVASSFLLNNDILSFKTSSHRGALVIDPKLEWSTYYGGENVDYETEVACNDSGYVYIAGGTSSLNNIATVGSHQSTYGGGMYDVYLAKFNGAGERLWATYYGGNVNIYSERFVTLTCDHFNNIYVAGRTQSTSGMSTPGSHQELLSGGDDAFLVKFSGQGIRIWGTYYGGDSTDIAQAVICDDSGNVFITGGTTSDNNISTPGCYQPLISLPFILTDHEAYLAKFDSSGVRQWGTYYGGIGSEFGYALATDNTGCIYLVGSTTSSSDIATPGSYQSIMGGLQDAFIVKFNNSGARVWATYYGGSGEYEIGTGLVIDGSNLYLCGDTDSPDGIATPGSHQTIFAGGITDAFLAKFDTAGIREWGTYYGGNQYDANQQSLGHKLALDNIGNIYLAYATNSITGISTPGAPQENYGGGLNQWDVFLVKFNDMGVRDWATYFGGCSYEIVGSCAADNFGNVYIAGLSGSDHMGTRGCFRDFKENIWDSYLAKFSNDIHKLNGDTEVCAGSTITYYASFVPGAESYTWTLPGGWTGSSTVDTINVTVGTTSGTISVVANKGCSTEPQQQLHVTVNLLPVPVINISGNVMSVAGTYVSYQWNNTVGAITGATNATYTITDPDEPYNVTVTDTNGCTGQSSPFTLSVSNHEWANSISLHPNPNTGIFTLTAHNLTNSKTAIIEITDITGRKILREETPVINSNINQTITLPKELPAGQYFLKLSSQETNKTIIFTKY